MLYTIGIGIFARNLHTVGNELVVDLLVDGGYTVNNVKASVAGIRDLVEHVLGHILQRTEVDIGLGSLRILHVGIGYIEAILLSGTCPAEGHQFVVAFTQSEVVITGSRIILSVNEVELQAAHVGTAGVNGYIEFTGVTTVSQAVFIHHQVISLSNLLRSNQRSKSFGLVRTNIAAGITRIITTNGEVNIHASLVVTIVSSKEVGADVEWSVDTTGYRVLSTLDNHAGNQFVECIAQLVEQALELGAQSTDFSLQCSVCFFVSSFQLGLGLVSIILGGINSLLLGSCNQFLGLIEQSCSLSLGVSGILLGLSHITLQRCDITLHIVNITLQGIIVTIEQIELALDVVDVLRIVGKVIQPVFDGIQAERVLLGKCQSLGSVITNIFDVTGPSLSHTSELFFQIIKLLGDTVGLTITVDLFFKLLNTIHQVDNALQIRNGSVQVVVGTEEIIKTAVGIVGSSQSIVCCCLGTLQCIGNGTVGNFIPSTNLILKLFDVSSHVFHIVCLLDDQLTNLGLHATQLVAFIILTRNKSACADNT